MGKYEKQSNGEYIEIFDDSNNLVAEFEYFDSGVFVGWEYPSDDERILDLEDGFTLTGEMYPNELSDMLSAIKEEYPFLRIVGYELMKNKFDL